jgi:hypothetical protein
MHVGMCEYYMLWGANTSDFLVYLSLLSSNAQPADAGANRARLREMMEQCPSQIRGVTDAVHRSGPDHLRTWLSERFRGNEDIAIS